MSRLFAGELAEKRRGMRGPKTQAQPPDRVGAFRRRQQHFHPSDLPSQAIAAIVPAVPVADRIRVWFRRSVPWLGLAVFAWFSARLPGAAFAVGSPFPAFSTTLADGSQVSIGQASPHVTVLNFWASYCGPCRAEAPVFSALQGPDVRVVGLSVEDYAPSVVAEQARRIGMQYPVGVAGEALVSRFRVQSVPTTYVLAKNGTIVLSRVGTVGKHELDDAVRAARSN